MTKYGRWEPVCSSSESNGDSENDQEPQGTQKEIEENVNKILNLIKNNEINGKVCNIEENVKNQSELIELIEDFHSQYKSLQALYENTKEELQKITDTKTKKAIDSSSNSSSDSEYYSPEEVSSKSSKWNGTHNLAEGVKQELENANLKRKLTFTIENEDLQLEYNEALSKNQELKKIISDLKIEAEQRQNMIHFVKDESVELREKLEEKEKIISFSKARENEVLAWKKDLEGQIDFLRDKELELEQRLECKVIKIKELIEEKSKLQTRVFELEEISEIKEKEYSSIVDKFNEKIHDLITQMDFLRAEKDDQIDTLEKTVLDLETNLKVKNEESYEESVRFVSLTEEFSKLKNDFDSLGVKKTQYLQSLNQMKTQNSELTNTVEEQRKILKEHEETINKTKSKLRIYERKMSEFVDEFCKNIEDNIRILCQRIQVAEALHVENKERYKATKDKFEQEHKMLLLNENNLKLLEFKEGNEREFEKKVMELENLVKEKEEGIQELGEEKKEAIRQLCILIDYHRDRYDHLKEVIAKYNARTRRAS